MGPDRAVIMPEIAAGAVRGPDVGRTAPPNRACGAVVVQGGARPRAAIQWYANFCPAPSQTSLDEFTQSPAAGVEGRGSGARFHVCPSQRRIVVSPATHTLVELLPRTFVSPSVVGTETTDQVPERSTLPTLPPLLHAPNPTGSSARNDRREPTRHLCICTDRSDTS